MCLIFFAWQAHPEYELVLAANRDEFHARPTAPADFWEAHPELLAGRDLEAGGTWMGVTRQGRFAAVTNYREHRQPVTSEKSRGALVTEYLLGGDVPGAAAASLEGDGYSGFNLLMGAPGELAYVSNRGRGPETLRPGVYGLSNHLLNTGWPKVERGLERFAEAVNQSNPGTEFLFDIVTDRSRVGGTLPGGVPLKLAPEELMRHLFIQSPVYGTRSSTVLTISRQGRVYFEERSFSPDAEETNRAIYEFEIG